MSLSLEDRANERTILSQNKEHRLVSPRGIKDFRQRASYKNKTTFEVKYYNLLCREYEHNFMKNYREAKAIVQNK